MWNRKVFIRIIEVLLCIACVVALRVTNDESRRVFHYLRSRSREWSLLNNITWGAIGAALATATSGGYIIITTGLLIAAATGELRGRKTEIFFLGLGVILFGIVGALSLASIENVPEDLIDNAAVFGSLCLFTALVFIADLLMSIPKIKDKQGTTGRLSEKRAKQQTSLTTEKESKSPKASPKILKKDDNGNVNDGFEKLEEQQQKSSAQKLSEDPSKWDQDRSSKYHFKDKYRDEENGDSRELKEYAQNFENRKALRDSQLYRESEMQRAANGDSYKVDQKMEVPTVVYKSQDVYQRPVDEVDTPRFPIETNGRSETVFSKVLNPGVKIMKVERDLGKTSEDYRYSDTSQYDNVPIRMRTSPKAQKKDRDVSFNIPPPPSKARGKEFDRTKHEIEMLEECFRSFRTVSTGTQTPSVRTPSSPTDPGYVRHTASNWPQETKAKTPASSPNRTTN